MPGKLTNIWFAAIMAILAGAGLPAHAVEMPASGTKNFIPGGGTPSYFTNENGAASAAAADRTSFDDVVDQTVRAPQFRSRPVHSAAATRRHGKLAVSHASGKRSAAKTAAKGRSTHLASAKRGRTATAGMPARPVRIARRAATPPKTRTAKAGSAKPAKPSTRHAAAKSAARKG